MLKARRSTKGPGVANIGEAYIQLKLRGLYPSRPHDRPVVDLLEACRQSVDHLTICIKNTDSLARYIMELKRGASDTPMIIIRTYCALAQRLLPLS